MPLAYRPRIILPVINDLAGDQRMHRIASTLAGAGCEVLLVGRLLPTSQPLAPRPYRTHRMRLRLQRGKLFYAAFNLRLLWLLLLRPADIIVANDLDTLLPCYLAARLRRRTLIYDSHELFTEVPELVHRPRTRQVWCWLEGWLFPRLRHVYTVNASLARIYEERYGVPVAVVRNLPLRRPAPLPAPRARILIYQGALNLGRGIDLMIRAMCHLDDCRLWIVGRGDVEDSLHQLAADLGLGDRVVFHGFRPWEELAAYTAQAALGLSLEEDLGANYRYASPNKVYDYIQAHTPVIVSDLPEMAALVRSRGVGEVLADRDSAALAALVRVMLGDTDRYRRYVEACAAAAETLHWEAEQMHLLAVYAQAWPTQPFVRPGG
ncbi:MAG: glycosyltransferase family 4 protein [Bacteroidia bacterium]